MADLEEDSGTSRKELLERVEVLEAMIREGRQATCRCGWIFVLWGVVDLTGLALQWKMQRAMWVWPVVIATGFLIQWLVLARTRRGPPQRTFVKSRSIGAVWGMMGLGVCLYVAAAMVRGFTWQLSYIAGILMMVGLAHAISAAILRWRVQAAAAALWWAGGVATYFASGHGKLLLGIVVADLFFGLVVFGLYVMFLERRCGTGAVAGHA